MSIGRWYYFLKKFLNENKIVLEVALPLVISVIALIFALNANMLSIQSNDISKQANDISFQAYQNSINQTNLMAYQYQPNFKVMSTIYYDANRNYGQFENLTLYNYGAPVNVKHVKPVTFILIEGTKGSKRVAKVLPVVGYYQTDITGDAEQVATMWFPGLDGNYDNMISACRYIWKNLGLNNSILGCSFIEFVQIEYVDVTGNAHFEYHIIEAGVGNSGFEIKANSDVYHYLSETYLNLTMDLFGAEMDYDYQGARYNGISYVTVYDLTGKELIDNWNLYNNQEYVYNNKTVYEKL